MTYERMPLKLDIPESLIPATQKMYRDAAQDVLKRISAAKREWEDMIPTLTALGIIGEFQPAKAKAKAADPWLNVYDSNYGWLKKAQFAIYQNGAMTAKEIVDYLVSKWEKDLDETLAGNSLPATLSVAARDGKINRKQKENGEYVYDLIK